MKSCVVVAGFPEDIADPLRRFLAQLVALEIIETRSSEVFTSSKIDLSWLQDVFSLLQKRLEESKETITKSEIAQGQIESLEREKSALEKALHNIQNDDASTRKKIAFAGIVSDMTTSNKQMTELLRQATRLLSD